MNKILYAYSLLICMNFAASAQDTARVHRSGAYDSTTISNNGRQQVTPAAAVAPAPIAVSPNAPSGGAFLLGIRFMPTYTSLSFGSAPGSTLSSKLVLGYGYGLVVGANFSRYVGVQAEVIYSSLSQKFTDGSLVNTVKLTYLQIPILFVLNSGYDQPVNFSVCIGPQFGINIGSSITNSNSSTADTLHAVLAVKPGDLGLAYGVGIDFGISKDYRNKISIGYRGVIGLTDISDRSTNLTTNQYYVLERTHVRTYAGYIGYTYAF